MSRWSGWLRLWVVVSTLIVATAVGFSAIIDRSSKSILFGLAVGAAASLILYVLGRATGWVIDGFRRRQGEPVAVATAPKPDLETTVGTLASDPEDTGEWTVQMAESRRSYSILSDLRSDIARGEIPPSAWIYHESLRRWVTPQQLEVWRPSALERQRLSRRGHIMLLAAAALSMLGARVAEPNAVFAYLVGAFLPPYILAAIILFVRRPFIRRSTYPSERSFWNWSLVILIMMVLSFATAPARRRTEQSSRVKPEVAASPLFAQVALTDSALYGRIEAGVTNALDEGNTPEVRAVRQDVAILVRQNLPYASDDALLGYMRHYSSALRKLQSDNPPKCYEAGFLGRVSPIDGDSRDLESERLMGEVLRTAREARVSTWDADAGAATFARAVERAKLPTWNENLPPTLDEQKSLCNSVVRLHDELQRLPYQEAVTAYRWWNAQAE